ncbi:bifunctional UDP-N-acetylglucosamine diphosphorylase/glucosamine-1-phosphate N-acetyltransferase GlmU [Guggenheimella bovis]
MKLNAVILAAGKSKRMKSKKIKVMHEILGRPVLQYVVDVAKGVGSENTVLIVSDDASDIREAFKDQQVTFCVQENQLGTADAVKAALPALKEGNVFILCGDAPLLTIETVKAFEAFHEEKKNALSVLTVHLDDPKSYGRIIRENGVVRFIREAKDASEEERKIQEINSGVFLVSVEKLKTYLPMIQNHNAQKEFYLTDLVEIMSQAGEKVDGFVTHDERQILGINTRSELAKAISIIRDRINEHWMQEGVTMIDPRSVYIDSTVTLQNDVVIEPNVFIKGNSTIESDALIGPNVTIEDSVIHSGAHVFDSTVLQSEVGEDTAVGPYAYMRPNSVVGKRCKVGDFVELKNATLGDDTKVSHLSYIGDADVGSQVNVGCGVVFVNYNGLIKTRSTVGDRVFIGCNANLISPVEIKEGAYIAAGTTVTNDVPEEALAIGRRPMTLKPGWAKGKTKYSK